MDLALIFDHMTAISKDGVAYIPRYLLLEKDRRIPSPTMRKDLSGRLSHLIDIA